LSPILGTPIYQTFMDLPSWLDNNILPSTPPESVLDSLLNPLRVDKPNTHALHEIKAIEIDWSARELDPGLRWGDEERSRANEVRRKEYRWF